MVVHALSMGTGPENSAPESAMGANPCSSSATLHSSIHADDRDAVVGQHEIRVDAFERHPDVRLGFDHVELMVHDGDVGFRRSSDKGKRLRDAVLFLEMSEGEMAAEFNAPTGTVKWLLNVARKNLRRLLASERKPL